MNRQKQKRVWYTWCSSIWWRNRFRLANETWLHWGERHPLDGPYGFIWSAWWFGFCCIMISIPETNTSDNRSLTTYSSDSPLFHSTSVRVFILCLLIPIPIFAIMGNLFIMAAVARIQSLWTPTNAFVVSLAMADFLVAVLVMPFSLVRSINNWHFGDSFCRIHFILDVTLCTASIFNLSCIALERYIAICDPLHYPARMSPRRVAMLLLLCWSLPLVISAICVSFGLYTPSPAAVFNSSTQQKTQTCPATFNVPFGVASSVMSFFIPMVFMLFAYGRIFIVAQKQARWIHAIKHHTEQLQMNQCHLRMNSTRNVQVHMERFSLKKESKAAKTLGLIMGVFLFCWLPFFCLNMIHPLKGYTISPLILEACTWLGYANSSLNPFLYVLLNKNYRRLFAAFLKCGILGRLLSSKFGRQTHSVVMLETISRWSLCISLMMIASIFLGWFIVLWHNQQNSSVPPSKVMLISVFGFILHLQ